MDGFESDLMQEQPPGQLMPSEQSTFKIFDPITAGLIHDTPSPDEVFRAIRSTPVINPLAIMRGQQTGPEMLPSTILKAQRMSAVKERAQLLALLQDTQAHQLLAARINNQQGRLAFDVMKQAASQGNAAVGAVYKTFSDIAPGMDSDQANKWLETLMSQDVSQGIPNEAAGRQMALQALVQSGGLKPKQKQQTAPSGFQYTPEGSLQGIPGGPADPNVIRQNAEARHITVNVGGGGGGGAPGGFFAPGMAMSEETTRDPNTGEMVTTRTPFGVMRPKGGGAPYGVPLGGVPQTVKEKPLSPAEAGRVQGTRQGIQIVDQIEQQIFPQGQLDRGVLAGATATRHGVPGVVAPEGALVNQRILQAMDPYVRSTTGAALNEQELKNANQMFSPGVGDSEAQVHDKLNRLRQFLSGNLNMLGMVLQPGSQAFQGMMSQQSGMPPVYQTPVMQPAVPQTAPQAPQAAGQNQVSTPSYQPGKVRKFNPMTGRVE